MPKMIVSIDGVVIKEVQLTKDRTTLGRRPYNDIVIDNLAVSGEHAVLQMTGNEVYLEDLNSTNGTYVNGKAIKKQLLQNGDTVEIGKDKIKYRLEPTQDEVFSLAGVWDEWVSPQQGKTVKTFSILTCEANPLMAEIHNTRQRMPVILGMESVAEWLNLDLADQRIKELTQPCPDGWLRAIKAAG